MPSSCPAASSSAWPLRALAMEPAVLLCDEITSALDPELVGEVLRVVEALADDGMTLIMVTHEMNFARKVSDRVIFMHQGRVHETRSPEAIFSSPRTPELQPFLSALKD
jgi:polar amino acid transport system ATP-binding protein